MHSGNVLPQVALLGEGAATTRVGASKGDTGVDSSHVPGQTVLPGESREQENLFFAIPAFFSLDFFSLLARHPLELPPLMDR